MQTNQKINLIQKYTTLNNTMYSYIKPSNYKNTELVILNTDLCHNLEIDKDFLTSKEGIHFLSGSTDNFGKLYAQGYAGHQYGYFTILGDGRAMNLGEISTPNGVYDLQLKGSGKTPYSRNGDGKATLYSMLREYLIGEAMHHLKVKTTRMLSVIKTNEIIQRKTQQQGAVLCRVASSHIRVGTFEYANAIGGKEQVKELADFTISRHFNNLVNNENKYQLLLRNTIKEQAKLIAKWQSIGFVHGVMNTDNMTISGETIDYGPCAFMNEYIPKTVFSSIDTNGRYAFNQQPYIGSWNLAKFAETLIELLADDINEAVDIANSELQKYQKFFETEWYKLMSSKIGIINPTDEEKRLVDELLLIMEKHQADYTNTFRLMTQDKYSELSFYNTDEWNTWFQKWTRFLGHRQMDVKSRINLMESNNPVIIPRNRIVEEALKNAADNNNYTKYNQLLEKLKDPYNYKKQQESYYLNPLKSDHKYITYCGT